MSSAVRNSIRQKLVQTLSDTSSSKIGEITGSLRVKSNNGGFTFYLPLKTKKYDISNDADNITKNSRDVFPDIHLQTNDRPCIDFRISRDTLIKETLEANTENVSPPSVLSDERNIVVEFSSPNIAKPFHVGHLRSTIIGNYIANLHNYLNGRVKRINYLGDWGTQFGFVELGLNLPDSTDGNVKSDPMSRFYEAYVRANKLAENDESVSKRAREIFEGLEKGDEELWKKWRQIRELTVKELEKTYERLRVSFDEYHWESMYGSREIGSLVQLLEKLEVLKTDNENRRVVAVNEKRNVPLIKSDGSTLYLTRDLAAAIDRYEKYNFDIMYYVVENAQTDHFANLSAILDIMKSPCAGKLRHVKFGRIKGMSTRKGTAVFLSDFLNEARDSMREKQLKSQTTKVSLDLDDNSSDCLGISAVVIHDLKQRRQRDYEFDWNVALDIKGETGVKLQYSHCRLVSLEENCGAFLPAECDPSLLREPIVDELVTKILQFDEAIITSYQTLEACTLAKYLFDLSHVVNRTIRELRVKGEPEDVGSQRLLLYRVARNVLAKGMTLLGIRPLDKM